MIKPSIAIVILNFNGIKDTLACLKSFEFETYPNYEIILVDNKSTDDSVSRLKEQYPKINLIESQSNLGFSGGNNLGVNYALEQKFDYIMLLNNDTLIHKPFLGYMIDAMQKDHTLAAVSPLIYFGPSLEEVWFGGAKVNYKKGTAYHENSQFQNQSESYHVDWLTGCAPLIRSSLLKQLGGFDIRYFLYWEDVDLSLRLRELGYNLAIEPKAIINHLCGQSVSKLNGQSAYYYIRNQMLLAKTHMSDQKGVVRRVAVSNLRRTAKSITEQLKKKNYKIALRTFRWAALGLWDYSRNRYGKREA